MTRRLLLSNYHSIEEAQSVALYASLGFEVLSLGAYLVPREPGDPKRPPLDIDPAPPEVLEACRDTHAAKQNLPEVVYEWLGPDGIIVAHHFIPETVFMQWPRLRKWGGRVIWRSDGQSSPDLERMARSYRSQGLERVAYSPKEQHLANYAGHDAIIRFGYDPKEYGGWTGHESIAINISQHLLQRGSATNWGFWEEVTKGLDRLALGPGSQDIGGPGEIAFDDMKQWLRRARAFLYTGTVPASYTLGLLEAAMTGIPVVSIGTAWFGPFGDLFEVPELIPLGGYDDPQIARQVLVRLLTDYDFAKSVSERQRKMIVARFGIEQITAEWREYLA